MTIQNLISALGVVVVVAAAWLLFSRDRRAFPWRVVLWGTGLQVGFALLLLKTGAGRAVFDGIRVGVTKLLSASRSGRRPTGRPANWSPWAPSSSSTCCRRSSSSRA